MYVYCKLYYKQNLYFHPPTALQPAVNPLPPIHSASKLFHSARSAFSCDTADVWQRLLSHRPLYYTRVSQLADCQWTKMSFFCFFRGLYSRVAVFVNTQHNLSCPFPRTAVTIPHKTTQMHNHIFLTALLTRYFSKGTETWCSPSQ